MKKNVKKQKQFWSDPVKFLAAMRAWQERGKRFPDQDELCTFYYPLAEKTVATYGRGHIDPFDLVQECVVSCCKKARFYDETRGSCFNFFTKVIIHRIKVIYAQENKKHNPKGRMAIDEEFIESVVSFEEFRQEPPQVCIKRKILTVEEVLKGMKNAAV